MSAETPNPPVAEPVVPAAQPVAPAQAVVPASAAAPPQQSPKIELSPEEYRTFLDERTRYSQWEADRAKERTEAQAKEFAALSKAGETEKAMNLLKQQMDENTAMLGRQSEERLKGLEAKYRQDVEAQQRRATEAENQLRDQQARMHRSVLDGELGRALASHGLVSGGAEQLATIWKSQNQFTVAGEGEGLAARATTGQTVPEFVAAQLARPEYAHFVVARTQGGIQNPGQNTQIAPASPANVDPTRMPIPGVDSKNLGEAMLKTRQARMAALSVSGDVRHDPGRPMALGPSSAFPVAR